MEEFGYMRIYGLRMHVYGSGEMGTIVWAGGLARECRLIMKYKCKVNICKFYKSNAMCGSVDKREKMHNKNKENKRIIIKLHVYVDIYVY